MADSMSVTNATASRIDTSKWKKLTPQEIIKEQSKGEEIPAEIVSWAKQVAAFSKIPDDVTYEQVDGDTGLQALEKLGLDNTAQAGAPAAANAQAPQATEQPDAVKDPANAKDTQNDNQDQQNIFMPPPQPGSASDTKPSADEEQQAEANQDLTLADPSLTTNAEEIRKRKARKGLA